MARIATIKQNPDEPVPTEVLADSIKEIAEGIRHLRTGRLNDRALILLIQDAAAGPLSKSDIRLVLDSIDSLEKTFLRK